MYHRAAIFLILASLLAFVPFMHFQSLQADCIAQQGGTADEAITGVFNYGVDPAVCPSAKPAVWMQVLKGVSLLCFAVGAGYTVQGLLARRRERLLLLGAGVNVPEGDLPIED
jgi:hypothetical protein